MLSGTPKDEGASIDEAVRDALAARVRGPHQDVRAFARSIAGEAAAEAAAGSPAGSTVARAVRCGARADRLGFAFVGGYFGALDALFGAAGVPGGTSASRTTSLAATEVGGVHPRSIEATLADHGGELRLRGQKTFVTLATEADDLLILARRDDPEASPQKGGRRSLVALRIPASRDGVRIEARPPTGFAPEVPHARVLLEDVMVEHGEILPGDGWNDWLRPFRTVEDVHVLAATAGYLLAVAREAALVDRVAADLAGVIAIAFGVEREGWSRSGGHLALESAFGLARSVFDRLVPALPEAMTSEQRRLERDAPLLAVAELARQQRLAVALTRVAERQA